MFTRYTIKRSSKDEGERPFWISFSDLMTALMALFLVVMSVTLLSVTKKIDQEEQRKIQRETDISNLMSTIQKNSEFWKNVKVDENTYRINLPEEVNFERASSDISPEGKRFLRSYVPVLLKAYDSDLGKRWIRRIVVEGFTDQDGSYLYNLGLSLDRSRKVVCALYEEPEVADKETGGNYGESEAHTDLQAPAPKKPDILEKVATPPALLNKPLLSIQRNTYELTPLQNQFDKDLPEVPLTVAEKELIRQLFLVGGYSFNSMRASKEESRRVEFKLEFWALDETQPSSPDLTGKEFGTCR